MPRLALGVAALAIVALGVLGLGVEGELRPTSLEVPGSGSAEANESLQRHFGDSAPMVVLLKGPKRALDRQGPRLIRALRRDSSVSTISPWDRGSVARLRPDPSRALVLVDFHVDAEGAVRRAVPHLDQLLDTEIDRPVTAIQTGFATLSAAIQEESVRSTRIAELIAIPFLLVVLLLVFRSPVAAAIPLGLGIAAVIAARGVLSLAASDLAIDGFALTVTTMMGLALGVDYALLMVSRFREELALGAEPLQAAWRTRRTAGRTIAFAGSTLFLAMAAILWVMPGTLFLSLAGTAILVTAISVAMATFVAPPLLYLLGPNVNRWQTSSMSGGTWLTAALGAALRRPRLVAGGIGAILLLLAAPAVALKTGPPSAAQLPSSNTARKDAEAVDRAIGPGWGAPFVLIATSSRGPITSDPSLSALRRTQRQIAADPGVQVVIGPAQVEDRVAPLKEGGAELLAGEGETSPAKLSRLGDRLDQAAGGVGQLRGGLAKAGAGAGLLAGGSDRAGEGAARLSDGLERAAAGARRAVEALDRLDEGSGQIAEGQRRATLGSRSLRDELSGLLPVLRRGGLDRARRLRADLREAATSNPDLMDDAREAERLVEALTLSRNQAKRAHAFATRLHSGQKGLARGGMRLHRGAERLSGAAQTLPVGLGRLRDGAARLAGGLTSLTGGAEVLSGRLSRGSHEARPLQRGLVRAQVKVSDSAARLSHQVGALRRSSPGLFDSGYFLLSAVDGAPAGQRERAGRVIDLAHGGQAAQVLVIPKHTFNTPGSDALDGRLERDADALASSSGLRAGVTGGPAQLVDYSDAVSSRVPLVVAVITLATFLVLVLVLRALALAAIAVALNLLTVAVAFGILTLLFDVPAGWPLGGHTYVDAIGAAGIFGIVFGLSIDYAVFLLTRMRESREAGATNEEAIAFGLERTARVITGAAAIMLAVFVAFAGAPIATVSQLGTGLAVAVVLDATVVRILLLPALMLLMGERVWWLPRALDRLLPRFGLHGTQTCHR